MRGRVTFCQIVGGYDVNGSGWRKCDELIAPLDRIPCGQEAESLTVLWPERRLDVEDGFLEAATAFFRKRRYPVTIDGVQRSLLRIEFQKAIVAFAGVGSVPPATAKHPGCPIRNPVG